MNNRLNKLTKDLAEASSRENEMSSSVGKKEKELALLKHEIKELQRKSEQESEARRKAESERAEIRKRLEDEMNKRYYTYMDS